MKPEVHVRGQIQKPVAEVFDAVYNPIKLSGYFTTAGASAPLDTETTVTWEFADFPGPFPVYVVESKKDQKLVFEWEASDGAESTTGAGYNTRVEFLFIPTENGVGTKVEIRESGWNDGEIGLKASMGNAQGWMNMLCCLKAYVEHGINLREGFFK